MTADSESTEPRSVTVAVVEAVAAEVGVPTTDLDCVLADVVDPGALDALFAGGRDAGTVEFAYCGCAVTVRADGTVEVQ